MTLVYNSLGGPSGSALTIPSMPSSAGNSGGALGAAFDFLPTIGGTASLAYSNTIAGVSAATSLHVVANATDQNAYGRWNSAATSPSGMFQTSAGTVYGWCHVYFPSLPAASVTVMAMVNAASTLMCTVRVLSTGFVSVRASDNTAGNSATTSNASTGKVVAGQWCRIAWKAVLSATVGQTEVKIWPSVAGALGETATSAANLNLLSTQSYGHIVGAVSASTSADYYVCNAGFSDAGYVLANFTPNWLSRWTGGVTASGVQASARVVNVTHARLVVDTVSDFSLTPHYSGYVTPTADGVVSMAVTGLEASTNYYYALELDDTVFDATHEAVRSSTGTFRTAGVGQSSFSFAAVASAKNFSDDAVFDAVRTRVGSAGAESRTAAFVAHLGNAHARAITVNTAAIFQRAWDEVMANPRQQALYAAAPTAYAMGDLDSGGGANHDGSAAAMAAAQSTYRSRVPSHALPAADGLGTYYSFVHGRVRFIVTDRYSYKSPIAATDNSSKTMLGAAQKTWLKAQLTAAEPVKVWLGGHWHAGATGAGDGSWAAYATERTELASYVAANAVRLVIAGHPPLLLGADSGTNSPGGIPFHGVSPLDAVTVATGGTYSAGTYPTSVGSTAHQYGWFDVVDASTSITITYTGYDSAGTSHATLATVFDFSSAGTVRVWDGTSWAACPVTVWNGTTWESVPISVWNGTDWAEV